MDFVEMKERLSDNVRDMIDIEFDRSELRERWRTVPVFWFVRLVGLVTMAAWVYVLVVAGVSNGTVNAGGVFTPVSYIIWLTVLVALVSRGVFRAGDSDYGDLKWFSTESMLMPLAFFAIAAPTANATLFDVDGELCSIMIVCCWISIIMITWLQIRHTNLGGRIEDWVDRSVDPR